MSGSFHVIKDVTLTYHVYNKAAPSWLVERAVGNVFPVECVIITKICPLQFKNLKFPVEYVLIISFFLNFAQNIDCGYTLEPPSRGGSNEYLQSMFWNKNKKNRHMPYIPQF